MNSRKIRQQKEMRDLLDRLSLFATAVAGRVGDKQAGNMASRAHSLLREIHFYEERDRKTARRNREQARRRNVAT